MMQASNGEPAGQELVVAVFEEETQAEAAVRRLIDRDFPMDMLSLLGKAQGGGDDPLGIYYPSVGERMKGWGRLGALWGGIWGLISGAAGMFLVPGVGPVLAAGPVVEALVAAIAGAGVGGGAMAGAAAASQLAVAMHRQGVPEERLQALQEALDAGHYVVMLRLDAEESGKWRDLLSAAGAKTTDVFPYQGLSDLVG
jgi:hypothetical protein